MQQRINIIFEKSWRINFYPTSPITLVTLTGDPLLGTVQPESPLFAALSGDSAGGQGRGFGGLTLS